MSTDNRKPPRVPANFGRQRHFQPGVGGMPIGAKLYAPTQHVRVMREAIDDFIELSIRAGHIGEMNVHLDAEELRSIAAALLDAAHDLEAHPAASLRAQEPSAIDLATEL